KNAVELARREFAQMLGSFQAPAGTPPTHPVALVACDDAIDPIGSARHLVHHAKVVAILGFQDDQEALDGTGPRLVPNDVLTAVSLDTAVPITATPHRPDQARLVWRTAYSVQSPARAVAAFVEQRLSRQAPPKRPFRVAFVRPKGDVEPWFTPSGQ